MAHDARIHDMKITRLLSGQPPRALEFCSGCGGQSLGLKAAGFGLAAHIEIDPDAAATHALNFAPESVQLQKIWSKPRDMVSCSLDTVVRDFDLKTSVAEAFDVLSAGLPCQAFARIGRSKLRSVTGDSQAFKNDPRAVLYRRFLRIVERTRPLAIIIENVPDILNFGGHNVPEEIAETLDEVGYVSRYTLLNAAFYGVPQLRERLFLIAVDASMGVTPGFPEPTHILDLPAGYEGSRRVALKHVKMGASHFTPIPEPIGDLCAAVSAGAALSDLPYISEHLRDSAIIRRRKISDKLPYRDDRDPSPYARLMRSWTGFEAGDEIDGNAIRLTPRDFPIFGRMPRGGDYPVALTIAHQLLEEKLLSENRRPGPTSLKYAELAGATVPPYDASKFPNKWWKLDPEAPSRTLTAHLGKDTYSHIHYDGRQKRMISVREAARLQSFPDGFKFAGAMNSSFRQIGNAVPPLLAFAVFRKLMETLSDALAAEQRRRRIRAA